VLVSGWCLAPPGATHTALCLAGEILESHPAEERTDTPFVAYRDWQWVRFGYRKSWGGARGFVPMDVLVGLPDQWMARFSTTLGPLPPCAQSPPPPHLMERVTGCRQAHLFLLDGLASLRGVLDGLQAAGKRHEELKRILDWGCGCGRLTAYLLAAFAGADVYGCDIDPEAVFWANLALAPGFFLPVQPEPPTPYPEGFFHLIVGCSVCTHLDRRNQALWLAELARMLAPGGLALLSVHGEYAASFAVDESGLRQLRAAGILDDWKDPALDGIAPPGYYRSVYQTEEYTRRAWEKELRVLAWLHRAMGNFQDLVVLAK
jgi:SAM-dependent methyltransferase